jgi:hypothetical protein
MAKKMNALVILAAALTVTVASGCNAGAKAVKSPFVAGAGVESGPGSGLWGDGSSGPDGMEIGCIRGRHFAVLITVRNRTKGTVTLLGAATQPLPLVIEPVAVQVSLAPPPSDGRAFVSGLRSWNTHDSSSVAIPAGREGLVQLNFLMRNCDLLRWRAPATVNRSITLAYSVDGAKGTQVVSVPSAGITLTRGPAHPRVPITQVG